MTNVDLSKLTKQNFDGCLNQTFKTTVEGQSLELTLVECKSMGTMRDRRPVEFREPFSVLFATKDSPQLKQGTYLLSSETIGELSVFLVPIGVNSYEAIFN